MNAAATPGVADARSRARGHLRQTDWVVVTLLSALLANGGAEENGGLRTEIATISERVGRIETTLQIYHGPLPPASD